MTWTYSTLPGSSDKDAVRFEIQDTNAASPLLADGEIEWAILNETGQPAGTPTSLSTQDIYRSAARCMESLSRLFAAQADTQTGSLKVTYSKQSQTYAERAEELREKASGMSAPYAGGQSISEKEGWQQNTDLTPPFFARDEYNTPFAADAGSSASPEDFGPPVG